MGEANVMQLSSELLRNLGAWDLQVQRLCNSLLILQCVHKLVRAAHVCIRPKFIHRAEPQASFVSQQHCNKEFHFIDWIYLLVNTEIDPTNWTPELS